MHENPCCRVGVCVHACLCKSEDYVHACVPIGSEESTLICVSEESVIEQKPFSRRVETVTRWCSSTQADKKAEVSF